MSVQRSIGLPSREPGPAPKRRPGTFEIGDVLDGRYELQRDLGRGAAGLVFAAIHRFTGRIVAVKLIAPDVSFASRDELHARLLREGRALAAVRHHGIVDILDGGITPDGIPYLVLEMLEGRTLEGLLASRLKLSTAETVGVALQLASSLTAAHEAGVVHRDLKPGNVFVVRDNRGRERIKLVDFGIAQIDNVREHKLTGIGALIGTPAYMALEQLLALDDVDERADIYALAVTMFECLTGRMPYVGNYQRVLLATASSDPVPSLLEFCPEAGGALAAVVGRGMSKKREGRYASIREFSGAIEDAVPGSRPVTTLLGPPPVPKSSLAAKAGTSLDGPDGRRRSPRAPYNTPVNIFLPTGSLDARTEDVSESGIQVIGRTPCEVDTQVQVRFALPIGGKLVTCSMRVRWVRAAGPHGAQAPRAMGLEFIDGSPEIRSSIARYVELMEPAKCSQPSGV